MSTYRFVPAVMVLLVFFILGDFAFAARTLTVQMKTSELRCSPSGLSRVIATVSLGDRLTVLEEKGAWARVSTDRGTIGWIPAASLTRGKVKINSGGPDARLAASNDEMSLATKGFTSQVEADFKNQHQDIDFAWVDRMVGMNVTTEEMLAFLQKGGVGPGKGAER